MCVCVRLEHSWICRSTWGGWLEGNIKCTWQCSLSVYCFHLLSSAFKASSFGCQAWCRRGTQGGAGRAPSLIFEDRAISVVIDGHISTWCTRCITVRDSTSRQPLGDSGMQRTTTDVQNHEIIIIAKYCKCNFVIFCMSYWHIIDICDMCQPIVRLSKAGRTRCHGPSFCLDP